MPEIRQICAELLDDAGVTPPFTAWQLCAQVEVLRGRPIRITATDLGGVTAIGHLVTLPTQDRILHDSRAPRPLQEAVIYHELAHLALGHLEPGAMPLTCGALLGEDADPREGDPGDAAPMEWEAEAAATELGRLGATRQKPDEYQPTATWSAEQGIAATFGLVQRRWRQT